MKSNKRRWRGKAGYKSTLEFDVAECLKKEGMGFTYEARTYPWKEKMPKACFCGECGSRMVWADRNYTPDFFLENGIIIEAKGIFEVKDRKIAEAMKIQYPDMDLRYVFLRDNTITPKSKTRYTQWCQKRDYQYATRATMEARIHEWCKKRK